MVVAVLEKEWHDERLKQIRLENFPGTPVGHPRDNVSKLLLGQDSVELDRELLHTDRSFQASGGVRRGIARIRRWQRWGVVCGGDIILIPVVVIVVAIIGVVVAFVTGVVPLVSVVIFRNVGKVAILVQRRIVTFIVHHDRRVWNGLVAVVINS